MTIDEAARRWSCPARTVRHWCQRGLVSGAVRVPRDRGEPRWMIPDGTRRPVVRNGRPPKDYAKIAG